MKWAFSAGLLCLFASALCAAEDPKVETLIRENSRFSGPSGKSLWVGIDAVTSPVFQDQYGFRLGAGYDFGLLGTSLHFSYGSFNYGGLTVKPDASEDATEADSKFEENSEINRSRSGSDSWTYWLIEPGASVTTRIFPEIIRGLSERGTVTLGLGQFFDDANSLTFLTKTIGFEASLIYSLGSESRWSVMGGLGYHAALMTADQPTDESHQIRRLPSRWLSFQLGVLAYCF